MMGGTERMEAVELMAHGLVQIESTRRRDVCTVFEGS
jgi:hypothetical protein